MRPTSSELLKYPPVLSRMESLIPVPSTTENDINNVLLNTIKLPKSIHQLEKRLPKAM